jgi:4-amino-4-deoxy-L-arabinose transferase-like glycosyltransferase
MYYPPRSSHSKCKRILRESLLSMTQQNRVTYLLLAVLGIALGLRLWGIGFALPYDFTIDEVHEILRAFKLGVGEYDWGGGGKGGLYYLLAVEYALIYAVWWMMGWVRNSYDFALRYFQDPSIFFLTGRLTVALMGAMTCLVIFSIGRRVYDWRVGLGAAFIGASAYAHGVSSHVINVDIGMTLAVWLSILAYLRYEETRSRQWLIAAGALGGVAIAFKLPGGIVLLVLCLAIASRAENWRSPRHLLMECSIVSVTLLVVLTLMAPETTLSLASLQKSFSNMITPVEVSTAPYEGGSDMNHAIQQGALFHDKQWSAYFNLLLRRHNLVMTVTALLGAALGLFRKYRWSVIWVVAIAIFLGTFTVADRVEAERYLLPIMPALWLLSSAAIMAVSGQRQSLILAGLACVVVIPLMNLMYQNYMWTKPDTRVLAKEWVETNIAPGAKILMDGMKYRFRQSPPLNPDKSTVDRLVAQASNAKRLSRGLSGQTLILYSKAMNQIDGPTYELYSTVYGLEVEDTDYYIHTCFDYIITSSLNSRYYTEESSRLRFPKSAQFYEQLKSDARFQVIYSIEPLPWKSSGPVITVYKILPACGAS